MTSAPSWVGGGPRILIVVVTFEAASTVVGVLDRIPGRLHGVPPVVLVADDGSTDDTAAVAERWAGSAGDLDVHVVRRVHNLGYGGNQAACYAWAAEVGAEIVVLLHGDAQYPPERIEDLVRPIREDRADVVFGSRMIIPAGARRGGMPLDRFVGNRVLTRALNLLCGSELTEWFSGFRAYRVSTLAEVDVSELPPGFDFDTAIICRLLEHGARLDEIAIETRYADEISRVPLIRTGVLGLAHGLGYAWRSLSRRRGRGRPTR